MVRSYRIDLMGELAQQLKTGPMRLRKGHVDSAEAILRVIEPHLEYPYEFVVYRLTGYRPRRREPMQPMLGQNLRHDLQRLILDVCDSFVLRADEYAEAVHDTADLARRFKVSSKTIRRWRSRGLVARRLAFEDGRKRIAFLESSVRFFVEQRRRTTLRSSRFTRLTRAERDDIIRRAKRLVQRGGCGIREVSNRLAVRIGRAPETIRYTIRRHDLDKPAEAVFPSHVAPLDDRAREVVYRCFLNGVPVIALARRYGRTRGSIYRIVNEMRARHLLSRKIGYIYNPQFDLPGADELILTEPPAENPNPRPRRVRIPKDLPPYLSSLYEVPLMTAAMERWSFRKYNYLKYRADHLRTALDMNRIRTVYLRQIERLLVEAGALKNGIIRANLRLVVSIARKHVHGPQTLFELISDGNISLMQAVEKFDYARGYKFSTYASWAIMKNYARSVPKERYLLDRFVTGYEEILGLASGLGSYDPRTCSLSELRDSLDVVLAQLSSRERSVVAGHFGLDDSGRVRTLEELGSQLGLSKERVRQIERAAMEKLRRMLRPIRIELMR